jgi:hypothetical protein
MQNTMMGNMLPSPRLGAEDEDGLVTDLARLVSAAVPKINFTDALTHKDAIQRTWEMGHLAQTRWLPPPSLKEVRVQVNDYVVGMTTGKRASDEEYNGALELGKIVGNEILKKMEGDGHRPFVTHLSLSGGSCFEASRSKGGKWHTMQEASEFIQFLRSPILEVADLDEEAGGYKDSYGNLICDDTQGEAPWWSQAYLATKLPGELGDHIDVPNLLDDSLAAGFDNRLGRLLFEWATRKHDAWVAGGKPPPKVNMITIIEPGGKIRPLTSGETWVYLYMVPAMHILKDHLEKLPGARVGLKESDHLYRFGHSYARHTKQIKLKAKRPPTRDNLYPEVISSSDLSSATDRAEHRTSCGLLIGLADGLRLRLGMRAYIQSAAELLSSAREIHFVPRNRDLRQFNFRKLLREEVVKKVDGRKYSFQNPYRGILMGEALTKVVLTLASMGAWYASLYGFDTLSKVKYRANLRKSSKIKGRTMFACCGDDHAALGPLHLVKAVPRFQETMYYEISWQKYRISKTSVHYCQGFGVHPGILDTIETPTIWMRLFNQFAKGGSQTQFANPDPLIGKSKELSRKLGFVDTMYPEEGDLIRTLSCLAMRVGMPSFVEKKLIHDPLAYLPVGQGGLGIPSHLDCWLNNDCLLAGKYTTLRAVDPTRLFEVETRSSIKTVWERGIELRARLHNFLDYQGLIEQTYDAGELFQFTKDSMSVDGSEPSARRVLKQVRSEFINLQRDNTLLGVKESPYAEFFRGTGKLQTVKKMSRASRKLRELRRFSRAAAPVLDDVQILDLRDVTKYGTWVSREALHTTLGIFPLVPSLFFSYNVFEGKETRIAAIDIAEHQVRGTACETKSEPDEVERC